MLQLRVKAVEDLAIESFIHFLPDSFLNLSIVLAGLVIVELLSLIDYLLSSGFEVFHVFTSRVTVQLLNLSTDIGNSGILLLVTSELSHKLALVGKV